MGIIFDAIIKKYSRTVGQRNEIDDIMASTFFVQRIFGQQILDPDWTWRKFIHIQIATVSLFIYVIFGTFDFLKNVTDTKDIGEAYYTLILTSFLPVKYIIFVYNRKTFQKLYINAKIMLYDFIKEETKIGLNVLKKCKFFKQLLFSLVISSTMMYILIAIYSYGMGTRITLSKTTSILMPMTTPYYEIGLLLHSIYLFVMAFTYMVIDMWFVLLTYLYCIASDSLVKVLNVKKCLEDSEEIYQTKLKDSLRRFYPIHSEQTKYLNLLNKMYKWATVIILYNVLICLCVMMLVMSEEINWKIGSNTVSTCVELFAYNWFGEQIKMKAKNLKMALLEFDWPNMRLSDKKNYLIIITYMNKDFGIQTVFGNELSLLTISAVLKGSYQAFAVLKSMGN